MGATPHTLCFKKSFLFLGEAEHARWTDQTFFLSSLGFYMATVFDRMPGRRGKRLERIKGNMSSHVIADFVFSTFWRGSKPFTPGYLLQKASTIGATS